jgi:hypothetical protein
MRLHRLGVASLVAWALANSPAWAQVTTGFEAPDYSGSAAGTLLTGQQTWYNPVAGSSDYSVFTYAGNALGLPTNPTGGAQFIGANPGTTLARGQIDTNFGSTSVWTVGYDVAHSFVGTLPAAQNVGSTSTQNPAAAPRQLIALHTWTDPTTAATWNAGFNVFDATGVALGTLSPGTAWNGLLVNHWYRESYTFDLNTNLVLSVSLTDLSGGPTNTFAPSGWYMQGGAGGGTFPLPTAFRFFAGSGVAANIAGWDNLSITPAPEPSSMALCGVGLVGLIYRRYRRQRA